MGVLTILLAGYKLVRHKAHNSPESSPAAVRIALWDTTASGMKNQKTMTVPIGNPIIPLTKTSKAVSNRASPVIVPGLAPKARIIPKSLCWLDIESIKYPASDEMAFTKQNNESESSSDQR